jgi:hypothetical protein
MHYDWAVPAVLLVVPLPHGTNQIIQRTGRARHAKVWPRRVHELLDEPLPGLLAVISLQPKRMAWMALNRYIHASRDCSRGRF